MELTQNAKIGLGIAGAALVGIILYMTMKPKAAGKPGSVGGKKPGGPASGKAVSSQAGGTQAGGAGSTVTPTDTATANSPASQAATQNAIANSGQANGVNPGAGSSVIYIVPHYPDGSGGKTPSGTIEVRTYDGVFPVGSNVLLTHPNYNGTFNVSGVWDSGDGTGSVFLNTPYIDISNGDGTTGLNSLGNWEDDSTGGTIAIVGNGTGTPNTPATVSADGADYKPNAWGNAAGYSPNAWESATGKKQSAGQNKPKHYLTPTEATTQKTLHVQGKAKGLKGAPLRNFITSGGKLSASGSGVSNVIPSLKKQKGTPSQIPAENKSMEWGS